ncbi:MAG TPA: hypothetical protein VIV60_32605 [Polyangiaceae bacterium]
MVQNRFLRLIDCLVRHDVQFIVVGGVAAVLQRVPVNTQDFDIVHERSKPNVFHLLAALDELHAVFRDDPRRLRPNESHLLGPGHCLLEAGNLMLDVLGAIEPGGSYGDLVAGTEVLNVGGYAVRVLTLAKLIEIKRGLARPKDRLMLMHLEATLDERNRLDR